MPSSFEPFNPRRELHKSRRRLPHWQQPGATYFVTFRLKDALPRETRLRLEELRKLNSDRDAFTWVDRYLDAGSGSCLLAKAANAEIVAATLRKFDGDRYALGRFVVMPNHVHVLVQPLRAHWFAEIIRSWKSFSAHELQRSADCHGTVWQVERFDRIVRSERELDTFDGYILENPMVAGLTKGSYLLDRGSAQWGI